MQGADARVLVLRCEQYDRVSIQELIAQGMAELGFAPRGRVFVKPNVVFAGDPEVFGADGVTNPAVLGAATVALGGGPAVERIDVGENCAVGFPTRYCFKNAGYYDEIAQARRQCRTPVDLVCMDEERRESVFVGGKVHHSLRLARSLARADAKIYLPKLKCHCVSNMTGAVKLNVGICSDDERSIHHDYLLDEKIVDLLSVGWPDLVVMDAIDVGVGNEAFPELRRLGLLLMGRNPLAVDLVGARLLGFEVDDVPYLRAAIDRGYRPATLDDVELAGDLDCVAELDEQAKRILPRDRAFTAWHDVETELERLGSPLRLCWGPYRGGAGRCRTGCIMGLKMFLAALERYAGEACFAEARPAVFVVGEVAEPIDAQGGDVFLLGSCAKATTRNAGRVEHLDKCFVTSSDLNLALGSRLGLPAPLKDPKVALPLFGSIGAASLRKVAGLRYAEDVGHFVRKHLIRRI